MNTSVLHYLPPGSSLGVMGGGQLGRMFVQAAQRLGYVTVVLDPDAQSPAGQIAHKHIQAAYLSDDGLAQLAQSCSAITTEFENVPATALELLAQERLVSPSAASVAVCQNRASEKALFVRNGIACAPHVLIASDADLHGVPPALLPGILKTASLGYDGKGQARIHNRDELHTAWQGLGRVPCVLEQRMQLDCEISVIVARSSSGEVVHFPVQRNVHQNGVLAFTEVPAAGVPESVQELAISSAQKIAQALEYVGVLCVEFFVLQNGELIANEMAPRPHNSGHYTLDACDIHQFELQVRTLTGAPLAAPRLHSPCVMLNVLGDLWFVGGELKKPREPNWPTVLALPGVHLHLYGKLQPALGRKMGHITITASSADQARAVARQVAQQLGLDAPLP
jgi:5-(carboxyamino)imidazole ribonucleotide synthase